MSMKISRRKLSRIHTIDRIWVARAYDVREENFHEWAQIREIHKSFLPRKFPAIGSKMCGLFVYILYVCIMQSFNPLPYMQVFVAAALMEYYISKDKNIAFKIFELGLKRYSDQPHYLMAYIDHLSHLNGEHVERIKFGSLPVM